MEKKSESWCSWLASGIENLFCLGKCKYKGSKLEKLGDNPLNEVIKYLDTKSLLALKYSNKAIKEKIDKLNEKTKEYDTKEMLLKENYEKNLLRCALMIFLYADRNFAVLGFAKIYVDYKTGEKLDIAHADDRWIINNEEIKRTLRDFAEKFIKPKDETGYNDLVGKISVMHDINFLGSGDNSKQLKLIENILDAGGFTDTERERMYDNMCKELERTEDITGQHFGYFNTSDFYNEQAKVKKQIQNHEKITGKSYKSIHYRIKNNHAPKKHETENYINVYEKMKKEEGSCNIF